MATATFSVRMDENLKNQFDELCGDFGMNMSVAINVFAATVVRERKIPFEISAKPVTGAGKTFAALRASARKNGVREMTLDEINAEIKAVRGKK